MNRQMLAAAAVSLVLLLCGCAPSGGVSAEEWAGLPAGRLVDYQLGGAYDPAPEIGGVVRDSTDSPAQGLYNICYVNGFQTQPDAAAEWLTRRPELILVGDDGQPIMDPNWPDEYILDTSNRQTRDAIFAIIRPMIERCATSGFDAVEIDNLDSFTRSSGRLTRDDAVALVTAYADTAHSLGLAIAQKNTSDLPLDVARAIGFDFAVAEECHRFDECAAYRAMYSDAVIDIEYADESGLGFVEACTDPDAPASMILRDRDLSAPGDPGYLFEHC